MRQVFSEVMQFRGSHADFGFFLGKNLRESPLIPNRKKQWGRRNHRHFIINPTTFRRAITPVAPKILDEIHGLAEALEMKTEEAVQLFGGYYLEFVRSGCSVFTDTDYMIRNYDSHPLPYEGHYLLYQPTDGGYATIGPSMQMTGRIDGMNEKGLVMGYNFTHSKKSEDGFLCNMIGRLILERCASVDEAISLLKEIPHRHSFSYVLLDTSGISYVAETSPRRVAVRRSHVCTNHFHVLDQENRYRQDESRRREKAIRRKQQAGTGAYRAFQVMNDPAYDIFSFQYDAAAGTLHTAAYFPKAMKTWLSIGPNRKPVIFDFGKWLKGADTNVTRIWGALDYPGAFANMEPIHSDSVIP